MTVLNFTVDVTRSDVLNLTPKFWDLHRDTAGVVDPAAYTLMSIQVNLVGELRQLAYFPKLYSCGETLQAAGTIAQYSKDRPDLQQLVDDILAWKYQYVFCLSRAKSMFNLPQCPVLPHRGGSWPGCSKS